MICITCRMTMGHGKKKGNGAEAEFKKVYQIGIPLEGGSSGVFCSFLFLLCSAAPPERKLRNKRRWRRYIKVNGNRVQFWFRYINY